MQMQMYVTDRKWCDFFSYNPNFKTLFFIKRVIRSELSLASLKVGLVAGERMILEYLDKMKNDGSLHQTNIEDFPCYGSFLIGIQSCYVNEISSIFIAERQIIEQILYSIYAGFIQESSPSRTYPFDVFHISGKLEHDTSYSNYGLLHLIGILP